jgi:hypothetical protein
VHITQEYEARTPPPAPSASRSLPQSANQEVADVIKEIIDMPAGKRPLRTVVGSVFTEGVVEYNEFYEVTKQRLRESLGRATSSQARA